MTNNTCNLVLIIACTLLSLCIPCAAGERVVAFHSDITVNGDSSLSVVETIEVASAGDVLRRRFYREFAPRGWLAKMTGYQDVEVLSVTRNGQPQWFNKTDWHDIETLFTGDPSGEIPAGRHTFVITYRVENALRPLEGHDSLRWDVVGRGWVFPAERVSATVTLPAGVPANAVYWDGAVRSEHGTSQGFAVQADAWGRPVFWTTDALPPHGGFEIAVSWPRGFVAKPSILRRLAEESAGLGSALIGLGILLAYFMTAWLLVGRDPKHFSVVPTYSPPDGLSPAAVGYLRKMGFDDYVYASALVSMAANGSIRIEEEASKVLLHGVDGDKPELADEEREAWGTLFRHRDTVELSTANHELIANARAAIENSLSRQFEGRYFRRNVRYLIPGVLLSVAIYLFVLFRLAGQTPGDVVVAGVWGVPFTLVSIIMVWAAARAWGQAFRVSVENPSAKRLRRSSCTNAGCATLFTLFWIGAVSFGLVNLAGDVPVLTFIPLMSFFVIDVVFWLLLRSATPKGRDLVNRIEGFKEYLKTTEHIRLRTSSPLEEIEGRFSTDHAYALALGIEQVWAELFTGMLVSTQSSDSS